MGNRFSKFMMCWAFLLLTLALSAKNVKLPGRAKLIEGITYKQTSQGAMKLDVYRPDSLSEGKVPVFVFIHGGSWMHGDRKELQGGSFQSVLLTKLLEEGYAVVSIEYRLISETNGVRYPEPLADCKDAIRWVRKSCESFHFDTCRIGVGGTSAGGHLALMTAYTPSELAPGEPDLQSYSDRVDCCVDFYGPTYLVKMFLPTLNPVFVGLASLKMKDMVKMRRILLTGFTGYTASHPRKRRKGCHKYSPLTYTRTAVPTIVFHGNKDRVVAYKQTNMLQKAMEQNKGQLEVHTIEGADHSFPKIAKSQAQQIANDVSGFLHRQLSEKE